MIAFAFLLAAVFGDVDPSLPRCPEVDVSLITPLDSANDVAGGSFQFKTVKAVAETKWTPTIPAGTRGFGVVAFADHAHGAGQPGRIVVEPRFLELPDGTHVQVISDPQFGDNFVQGDSHNVSGALQYVPVLGYAVGGYNALHRGGEITIAPGTQFRVVLGDALADGACYEPPPSELNVR